jgi:hypothetical protein
VQDVDWIKLTQDRVQCLDLVNTIMNLLYFRKEEYFHQLNTYKLSIKKSNMLWDVTFLSQSLGLS